MKQLSIKEIAPYLPYGLKVFDQWSENNQGEFLEVHGFDGDMQEWLLYDNIDGSTINYCKSLVKMVLRPLSDLAQEIEHNGEKFVPIKELGINKNWLGINDYHLHVYNQPYSEVQKLLEWHFDVFNLHENGLCIYYNEL